MTTVRKPDGRPPLSLRARGISTLAVRPRAARRRLVVAAYLSIAVAGCTIYHRAALDAPDIEAILQPPDRAALERAARNFHHDRLAPVPLDFSKPLTLDEIGIVAVLTSPELKALREQQRVADAQGFAAGLLPDPTFSIGRDRVLGGDPQGTTAPWAASLALDVFGSLATMPVERRIAKEAARAKHLDIAWQEWATAGQARLLAQRLSFQERGAALTAAAAEVANAALRRALTASERHDLKADEIETRRVAAAEATGRALAAAKDRDGTRLDLNRTMGLPPTSVVEIEPPPPLRPWTVRDANELFTAARHERLDLLALSAGYESQEATLHRAVLGQYPRLSLTLNRARDSSNVNSFGPSVGLDLPLWNANRGAIRIAKADRQRVRAEYAARLFATRADISDLISALDRDEATRHAFAEQAPDLDRIAAVFEAAAARSDVARPVAEAARAAATDRAIALLSIEQACAEERLGLAIAIGQPLASSDISP